jgi:hydrogenase expression/formation protein HypC
MCLAIPGQIVELLPDGHLAIVEVSRIRRTINIDLLDAPRAAVGEWVLIHVGFAMTRISAERADEQLRLLAMLGEDVQAMNELDGYSFGQEGPDRQDGRDGENPSLTVLPIPPALPE